TCQDVLEVAAAPVRFVLGQERPAVARGSAEVRAQDSIAPGGQELRPGIEGVAEGPGRPAMNVHEEGHALARRPPLGAVQGALDFRLIEARIAEELRLDKLESPKRYVELGDALGLAPCSHQVDLRQFGCSLTDERQEPWVTPGDLAERIDWPAI